MPSGVIVGGMRRANLERQLSDPATITPPASIAPLPRGATAVPGIPPAMSGDGLAAKRAPEPPRTGGRIAGYRVRRSGSVPGVA
jgi:hypothetical protein